MAPRPKCKMCKRVVKAVSRKRLCPACVVRKVKTSVRQMQKRKGKIYKKWKLANLEAAKRMPM